MRMFGTDVLSGKMLLVRIVEINKIYSYGQVRLSKGQLCPTMLGRKSGYGPKGLEPPAGA